MKVTIEVYLASELPEKIKAEVIDKYRAINIDFDDWYEFIVEEEVEKLKDLGVFPEKICFDLDSNYLYFQKVNIQLLNQSLLKTLATNGEWKTFAEYLSIAALMGKAKNVGDYFYVSDTEWGKHGLTIDFSCDDEELQELFKLQGKEATLEQIDEFVKALGSELEEYLLEWARNLLHQIRAEYESLLSDETVVETLDANEYHFTDDGTRIKV